nr:hypothetical protein [Bacillus licheniformis]
MRLVIAENGTILDVFPADYALQSPHALSDDALQSLKEATRNALIAKRDAVHRKWCEVEVDFHSNSYEIARRLALIGATGDEYKDAWPSFAPKTNGRTTKGLR